MATLTRPHFDPHSTTLASQQQVLIASQIFVDLFQLRLPRRFHDRDLSVETLPITSTDFPVCLPFNTLCPLNASGSLPNNFPVANRDLLRYNGVNFVLRNSLKSLLNPVQSWPPLGSQRRLVDVYQFGRWVQTSFEPEHTHVLTRRRTCATTDAWT